MFRHLIIAGVTAAGLASVPAVGAFGAAPSASAAPVALAASAAPAASPAALVAPDAALAAPSPSADPDLAALRSSLNVLNTTSHNVQTTSARSLIRASLDPKAGRGALVDQVGTSQLAETVVNRQIWLKLNIDPQTNRQLGVAPDQWLALDMSRVKPNNPLPIPADASDPVDLSGILSGVTTIDQPRTHQFTGTLDLTKITGRNQPDPSRVQRAGPAAKSVPFAAATDANNRISEFRVDSRKFDPGLSVDVKYTGYGVPQRITPPPTSVPAPETIYMILSR